MNILILGGGAAGFFAAIQSKRTFPKSTVTILEKSPTVLAKVKVSGGGRCNVTHACFDPRLLSENYPRGSKALLGPLTRFGPQDTMDWFSSRGVPLKIESDNRVFPVSDSSQTIIDCLFGEAESLGVRVWTECPVESVRKDDTSGQFMIQLKSGVEHSCDRFILASGSSRQGYAFAEALGHRIEPPVPSLFTFTIPDPVLTALSGLSVQNAHLRIAGVKSLSQKGPLLITHWGLSGPAVLKLSAWGARHLYDTSYKATLLVNWLPELTEEDLIDDLKAYQTAHMKKAVFTKSPFPEIPVRLWRYLVAKACIADAQTWKEIPVKIVGTLARLLNQSTMIVTAKGPFKEEFVTCGGVSLKEVNFKTMESTRCQGLYFAGEVLDVDGVTGGFNFQNAWATGWIAGSSVGG